MRDADVMPTPSEIRLTEGNQLLPGQQTRLTLVDVARVAGVSLATVDRVINRRPGVSKRAVTKVEESLAKPVSASASCCRPAATASCDSWGNRSSKPVIG